MLSAARITAFTSAAVLAAGTALLGTSPALAATRPTLAGPAATTGYGAVTLTGTARPGASVRLYEAAYIYRDDMYAAQVFFPDDIVSAVADSAGRFTLRRRMDSGFVFAAEADGLRSEPALKIDMMAEPTLAVKVSGTSVTVSVSADPAQPWLPVAVQRQSGTTWTTVVRGSTLENGLYAHTLTGQPSGTQRYRAEVGPDPENAIRLGRSATVAATIAGTGTPSPVGPAPKAGDVRFTLVQYNAPGADTNTVKSLNGEYWRITNKTKKSISLTSWTVRDRAGNTYRFPALSLGAGRGLTVATGKGTTNKPSGWRYWGRGGHVLNNTGDGLYLRSAAGRVIDSCGWQTGSGRTYC